VEGTRRFQHRRCGDSAGEGEAVEIDHLLSKRDDERDPEEAARDASQHEQRIAEPGDAKNEQGRDGEHHPGRGAVDRAGQGLVDVVLDDAVPAHQAAEDAEAEDRGELGPLDREAELEAQVADADGDQDADRIAYEHARPSELRVLAVADRLVAASCRRCASFQAALFQAASLSRDLPCRPSPTAPSASSAAAGASAGMRSYEDSTTGQLQKDRAERLQRAAERCRVARLPGYHAEVEKARIDGGRHDPPTITSR
jgi:hypothetical protein